MYDYLVVGAGFAGATMAERLAAALGARVLLIDRREHLAGNAYDPLNEHGVRIHLYGPHIFHTSSERVVEYLSRFTDWRPYEHAVLARVRGRLVPIPINQVTLNDLFGVPMSEDAAAAFLASRAEPVARIATSEDAIVAKVGRELYELFFRGYTRKQWGLDPSQLDPTVCGRIPTRVNGDCRYFTDAFQQMPRDGYGALFAAMVDHPLIDVALGVSYREIADRERFGHVVFTGPIDEFYEHRFGPLPYRSLHFEFETHGVERYQEAPVINEPDESVPYTRTTEFKYVTGQAHPMTTVVREYPRAEGDPYYPIPNPECRAVYQRYAELASRERHVTFVGRLAEYRYYNMDQVVASALATFDDLAKARV
ncbi:MAG TPA: UDP-galactopyranose mutase [Candidatus Dormibacteraeota bacterium]|nr:UDP-galactopyranose mutase [Candidatus Dormibacteraeota bacterium]